jgi:uncharacterized phage-associated protein
VEHFASIANVRIPRSVAAERGVIDVRALANAILDRAASQACDVTNMALNKIVYFVHCDYLTERSEALVSAKIEAWQHGPVFREVYHEFKRWGDEPIRSRATKVDPDTGEAVLAELTGTPEELENIESLIDRYVRFSAAHLRAISHASGGPWHRVWGHDGRTNPGMRISNELIQNFYTRGVRQ